MKLNHKKSSIVMYSRSPNYYPYVEQLQLSGSLIMHAKSVTFLGVALSECLNCKNHICHIFPRITPGMIQKLMHICPPKILRTHYFLLAYTHIMYCVTAWSTTAVAHLHQLRGLQNKVMTVMAGDGKCSSISIIYDELKILLLFTSRGILNALMVQEPK